MQNGFKVTLIESELPNFKELIEEGFDFDKEYLVKDFHGHGVISIILYDKDNIAHSCIFRKEQYRMTKESIKKAINSKYGISNIEDDKNELLLETRPCGKCFYYRPNVINEPTCCKYLLDVNKNDNVCYLIKEGTCFIFNKEKI